MKVARFPAMGAVVEVGGADRRALREIMALFHRYERVFSRFRLGSELNRVNAAAGKPVRVTALFAQALRAGLDAAAETEGLVDPTLGLALEAAGYDRDFAHLDDVDSWAGRTAPGCWGSVRLAGCFVAAPPRVHLDLNGVVKGLTVDAALALLDGPGHVSAGGDLAARGGLVVGLPRGGSVRLVEGGLATSGSARRTWLRGGRRMHHLIDPRTGRPCRSPWEQVTACGASCLAADIAAKAAFLAGPEGPGWLDARGVPGRFLGLDGSEVLNEAWRASVGHAMAA